MITPEEKTYFEKLILRLNLAFGSVELKPLYIGSLGGDGLLNQFAATEFIQELGFGESRLKQNNFNCIVINGHLNLIQADLLDHLIRVGKNQIEHLIYIKAPLTKGLVHNSYFTVESVEERFNPDIIYKKSPVDFEELFSLIKEKKKASLHG